MSDMHVRDHIVAAEYGNAEHTEIIYTTANEGLHRIKRDENPSFWNHILQRAVLKTYDPSSLVHAQFPPQPAVRSAPAPQVIDITPKVIPDVSGDLAALKAQIDDKNATIARLTMALKLANDYAETEAAAEYAVLAMAPDGMVDPDKKSRAVAILAREATKKSLDLTTLCVAIAQERDDRNRRLMEARLQKMGA